MAVAGYAIGAKEGRALPPGRVRLPPAVPGESPGRPPEEECPRQEDRRKTRLLLRHHDQARRRRLRLRRGIGPAPIRPRRARRAARPAALPRPSGYRFLPTTVNNVETLCAAARILEKGAVWFKAMGTARSAGTKVLSVSGDCKKPGVYEIPFGLTVRKLLEMAGGSDARAVQVGGPSGTLHLPGPVRPDDRLRGPGHGRIDHRHRPGPRPVRSRPQLHGILRRGIVRLVRPLPGGQSAAPAEAGKDHGRQGHALRYRRDRSLGQDDQGHEPLRPRADLAQPDPDDHPELPRDVRSQGRPGQGLHPRVRPGRSRSRPPRPSPAKPYIAHDPETAHE